MIDSTAKHGDLVIGCSVSWQGHETFGGKHKVNKTYKNGNVVLIGMKGQFYHTPTNDGYKLRQCSGTMEFLKLTDDVKLRIKKSKSIQELFTEYHALEKAFMNNRRFISHLSVDEINRTKQSFTDAISLIKDGANEK